LVGKSPGRAAAVAGGGGGAAAADAGGGEVAARKSEKWVAGAKVTDMNANSSTVVDPPCSRRPWNA